MAAVQVSLGALLVRKGDRAAAEPLLTEAVAWRRKSLPAGHRAIGDAEAALADCLLRQSRFAEAEPLLLSALKTAPSGPGTLLHSRKSVTDLLVALYEQSGRKADAQALRARFDSR
jgi:tetratricopeptide (TPR) repeat protein